MERGGEILRERNSRTVTVFLFLVFSCLLLGMAAGCHSQRTSGAAVDSSRIRMANKHVQLGDAFYDKGRISDAIREWEFALELDPARTGLTERIIAVRNEKNIDIHSQMQVSSVSPGVQQRIAQQLQRAEHYYRKNQLKAAEMAWQHVLALAPANRQAQAGLDRLVQEKYQSNSERGFDCLIRENYEKGMSYYRQRAWQQAEPYLASAAKLAPDHPQVDKYLQLVREALAQEQKKARVRQLRCEAEEAEKDKNWLKANQLWKKITEIEPNATDAREGVLRTGKEIETIADNYVKAGKAASQTRQYAKALAEFKKALEYNPDNAEAQKGKVRMLAVLAQSKADSATKTRAQSYFERGLVYYKNGQLKKAVLEWEKAIALDVNNKEYKKFLGRAKIELDEKKARACHLAKTRYNDGLQAFQREDLEAALAAFKDVIELCPDNPEAEKAAKHIKKIKKLMK